KGRKAEFAAFHAFGEAPDPQSVDTFKNSKLQWNTIENEPHKTMLAFYKEFIKLRKSHPALRNLNRENLTAECKESDQTLTIERWHEGTHVWCIMNFSNQKKQIAVPTGRWEQILNSADPKWKGPASAPQILEKDNEITVQPESIVLYKNA
ncbi:MAG: DUF3459 domain-containing protein, partial [Cytophagaceae bacterium]